MKKLLRQSTNDSSTSLFGRLILRVGHLPQTLPDKALAQIIESLGTRAFTYALGFVNSILLARTLLPEGRGTYSVALTWAGIALQLSHLGLHASNTYFSARDHRSAPSLFANSLVVGLASIGVAIAILLAAFLFPALFPIPLLSLGIAIASVPVSIGYLLLRSVILGLQNIRRYNAIDAIVNAIGCGGLLVCAASGVYSVDVFLIVYFASQCAGFIFSFLALQSAGSVGLAPSKQTLRACLRYGLKTYLGCLFMFLFRVDLILVGLFHPGAEPGYYSVALGITEMLVAFPTVVGGVMFARLSAIGESRQKAKAVHLIAAACGMSVSIVVVFLYIFGRPLVRLLYGPTFDEAVVVLYYLLPSAIFASANTIYMNYFAAMGMPIVPVVYVPFASVVASIAANALAIPTFGSGGAAVVASAARALMLLGSLSYLRSFSNHEATNLKGGI